VAARRGTSKSESCRLAQLTRKKIRLMEDVILSYMELRDVPNLQSQFPGFEPLPPSECKKRLINHAISLAKHTEFAKREGSLLVISVVKLEHIVRAVRDTLADSGCSLEDNATTSISNRVAVQKYQTLVVALQRAESFMAESAQPEVPTQEVSNG
jgi:hypothetical protein